MQQGVYIAARKSRLGGLWPWLPEAYFKGPMAESANRFGDAAQLNNIDVNVDAADTDYQHDDDSVLDSDTELEAIAAEHSSSRAHTRGRRRSIA